MQLDNEVDFHIVPPLLADNWPHGPVLPCSALIDDMETAPPQSREPRYQQPSDDAHMEDAPTLKDVIAMPVPACMCPVPPAFVELHPAGRCRKWRQHSYSCEAPIFISVPHLRAVDSLDSLPGAHVPPLPVPRDPDPRTGRRGLKSREALGYRL